MLLYLPHFAQVLYEEIRRFRKRSLKVKPGVPMLTAKSPMLFVFLPLCGEGDRTGGVGGGGGVVDFLVSRSGKEVLRIFSITELENVDDRSQISTTRLTFSCSNEANDQIPMRRRVGRV